MADTKMRKKLKRRDVLPKISVGRSRFGDINRNAYFFLNTADRRSLEQAMPESLAVRRQDQKFQTQFLHHFGQGIDNASKTDPDFRPDTLGFELIGIGLSGTGIIRQ